MGIADADGGVKARAFVETHGITRFFDVGQHGICHQVIAENGLACDPDRDATYAERHEVDLTGLEPYVARPGGVARNAVPISGIEARKVDQCFIGSCANGQLEDLRIAAEVLSGHKVAPGVRPIVTNSTCGACFGYHMGLLGAGEVCLTASTRNFRGRMGSPDAEIYMASPYAVAAAAVAGHIIDPRKVGS